MGSHHHHKAAVRKLRKLSKRQAAAPAEDDGKEASVRTRKNLRKGPAVNLPKMMEKRPRLRWRT